MQSKLSAFQVKTLVNSKQTLYESIFILYESIFTLYESILRTSSAQVEGDDHDPAIHEGRHRI